MQKLSNSLDYYFLKKTVAVNYSRLYLKSKDYSQAVHTVNRLQSDCSYSQ